MGVRLAGGGGGGGVVVVQGDRFIIQFECVDSNGSIATLGIYYRYHKINRSRMMVTVMVVQFNAIVFWALFHYFLTIHTCVDCVVCLYVREWEEFQGVSSHSEEGGGSI